MGSKKLCIFILIATLIAAIDADAPATKDIVIGDNKGWNLGVNITDWMSNTEVIYGDKLIFNYPPGKENVVEVEDFESYSSCTVPPNAKIHSSGHDVIQVNYRGRRCFFSGVENGSHCKAGLKFCHYIGEKIINSEKLSSSDCDNQPKEYIVGDEIGWNGGDLMGWPNGKEFFVNDVLVFNYPVGKHNVIEVKEGCVHTCVIPKADEQAVFESGHDKVKLERPGLYQFTSGVGKDCLEGYRLQFNVAEKKPKPLKGARKLVSLKE